MKRKGLALILALTVTIVMCFTGCGNSGVSIDSDLSMAEDVEKYVNAIDIEYAYDLTEKLAYDEEYWDCELGWRTAGSDAEHRCADFLAEEMEKIGLTDIEKIPTKVDKFQFNDSSLTVDGTEIDLTPAAYQCSGTDKDGITAEIVNVGTGFEADYDGLDVKDKIVIAQVDQANESWIDGYIRQAHEKGAAALVSYANSGYGELNEDTANVQDICCADLIPTVAISYNQAQDVLKAIEAGNNKATLMVDAEFEPDKGTSYNVVGYIKGKSSDQQIMLSGHYDKYWYGFQDDCAAIGMDFTIAKAMIDSGYVPENDIAVVAHGAEEWGATGAQFDWTTGAWGMIHTEKPEWAEKTIAMLNCELPAFEPQDKTLRVSCVPEFATMSKKLISESGLVAQTDIKLDAESVDASNMEDGVSYRWHGVPYMLNGFLGDKFMCQRYHTIDDDKDTWSEETMLGNLYWFGTYAIYIDKTPALELDMTQTCDRLEKNLNEELAKVADVDTEGYKAALADMKAAAEAYNKKIADINAAYEKAMAAGDDTDAIRAEGKKLNKQTLKVFAEIQKAFMETSPDDVAYGHPAINTNAEVLQGAIAALEKEELYNDDETGALDVLYNLNGVIEYNYYIFGVKPATDIMQMYDQKYISTDKTYWGTDAMPPIVYTGETTHKLARDAEAENDIDYKAVTKVYESALADTMKNIKLYADREVKDMAKVAKLMK